MRTDYSGDRYWQPDDYEFSNVPELQIRASRAGYTTPRRIEKADMIKIMHRIDPRLPNYNTCSLVELRKFAADRKLVANPKGANYKQLVHTLTAADDDARFSRLLDLPPELRCIIYRWYMAALPEQLEHVVQPPLTQVSSLLRAEATPTFYESCHFLIRMDAFAKTRRFRFDPSADRFLASLSPRNLAALRRFQLSFDINSNRQLVRQNRIEIKLGNGTKGILPRVSARHWGAQDSVSKAWDDQCCKRMESTLIEFLEMRKSVEREDGKGRKLRVEDLYAAKRIMEEAYYAD